MEQTGPEPYRGSSAVRAPHRKLAHQLWMDMNMGAVTGGDSQLCVAVRRSAEVLRKMCAHHWQMLYL